MPILKVEADETAPPNEGQEFFEGHAVSAGISAEFASLSATEQLQWQVMAMLSDELSRATVGNSDL